MKITIYILLLQFLIAPIKAQKLSFLSVKNYPKISYAENANSEKTYIVYNTRLFVLNEFDVAIIDLNTDEKRTHSLVKLLPKNLSSKISNKWSFYYYISNNKLFIKNFNNIFIFNITENDIQFSTSFIFPKKNQKNMYLRDTILFIYSIYNMFELLGDIPSGYTAIKLKDGSHESVSIPFKYLPLTHIGPNKFIDFNTKGYVVCDPFEYKLFFYDYKNKLIDSLQAPDSSFTASKDLKDFEISFPKVQVSKDPGYYFEKLQSFLQKTDRIWTINFMDDETIFTRITRNTLNSSGGKQEPFFVHIWKKIDNTWRLTQVKNTKEASLNAPEINSSDLWPVFIPGSDILFNNGFLYYLFWGVKSNDFPQPADRFYGFKEPDRNKLFLKVIKFGVN